MFSALATFWLPVFEEWDQTCAHFPFSLWIPVIHWGWWCILSYSSPASPSKSSRFVLGAACSSVATAHLSYFTAERAQVLQRFMGLARPSTNPWSGFSSKARTLEGQGGMLPSSALGCPKASGSLITTAAATIRDHKNYHSALQTLCCYPKCANRDWMESKAGLTP